MMRLFALALLALLVCGTDLLVGPRAEVARPAGLELDDRALDELKIDLVIPIR